MASLTIPEPVLIGFTKIATLSDEAFRELLSALENVPLKIQSRGTFDDTTLFKLRTIPPDDIRAIRDTVFSLYLGRVNSNVSVSTYVKDIVESLQELSRDDIKWALSEETLGQFQERLTQLLSVSAVELIAKANDVLTEHAQTFSKSRIVSEIRPVYGENIDNSPSAAVIAHMLTITYFQDGKRHEFVVALDTKDIQQLMETLKRAEAKTESLKSIIASTSMAYVEVV